MDHSVTSLDARLSTFRCTKNKAHKHKHTADMAKASRKLHDWLVKKISMAKYDGAVTFKQARFNSNVCISSWIIFLLLFIYTSTSLFTLQKLCVRMVKKMATKCKSKKGKKCDHYSVEYRCLGGMLCLQCSACHLQPGRTLSTKALTETDGPYTARQGI